MIQDDHHDRDQAKRQRILANGAHDSSKPAEVLADNTTVVNCAAVSGARPSLSTQNHPPFEWESDRVRAKSSIDILLEWLLTDGHYSRWVCGQWSHEGLCFEINSLLCAQGILHRKLEEIQQKIAQLEMSFAFCTRLLAQNGFAYRARCSLQECEADLRSHILQHCPYFELLSSVMIAPSGSEQQQNCVRQGIAYEENDLGQRETEKRTYTVAYLVPADDKSGASVQTEQNEGNIVSHDVANGTICTENEESSEDSSDEDFSGEEADANASWTASWETDRVKEKSSMHILIEWIVSEDNYVRWEHARRVGPAASDNVCKEIRNLLMVQGISHRSIGDIRQAIQDF